MLKKGSIIHVAKLVPIEFCQFFTHSLLHYANNYSEPGDTQVPTAKAVLSDSLVFDTLQERLWPTIEKIVGEELLPTYTYARLYSNGDILEKHVDRPACEVSITIQLGRSHHYAWPIYMEGQRFDLGEGDGVIYSGCESQHWRNVCDGPDGYYSGQVFLHFVRKNGPYAAQAGDSINRKPPVYIRNRTDKMEAK